MNRTRILTVLFVGLFAGNSFAARSAGTYAVQGVIRDNAGDPFNGNLNVDVRIWNAAFGGQQVDLDGDFVITAADTIVLATVAVVNGNLATKFDLNTTIVFAGTADRWMELTLNGVAQTRTEIQSLALSYQMRFPGSDDLAIITNATNEIEVFAALKSGSLIIDGISGPDATLQSGNSLMTMNAITGTITINSLAASSTADGTALVTEPIVLDPVNNTISSGASKIKLNTVAGTVEINSTILSGTAQATVPIVLDPVNNTISSGNAEMEMDATAGLFLLRSRILSGANAESGFAQLSVPIEINPNAGTIRSGNAKMIMDTVSGTTTFDSLSAVAQATVPIVVDPVNNTIRSGNAKMIMDTVSGTTTFDSLSAVAQATVPIVLDPVNNTISSGNAKMKMDTVSGTTTFDSLSAVAQATVPIVLDPVNNTIRSGDSEIKMVAGTVEINSLAAAGTGGVAQITSPIVFNPADGTVSRGLASMAMDSATGKTQFSGDVDAVNMTASGDLIVDGAGGIQTKKLSLLSIGANIADASSAVVGAEFFLDPVTGNVELEIGGARAMCLTGEVACGGIIAPNVILGWSGNDSTGTCGSTISGGGALRISDQFPFPNAILDDFGTIGGGFQNIADGYAATVCGGSTNHALANRATVSGGSINEASGAFSAIGGGRNNFALAQRSTVPGGQSNTAGGDYSFAAGHGAIVRDAVATGTANGDEGTFVWNDFSDGTFTSSGINQFLIHADGGVGIGTTGPNSTLHVNGDGTKASLRVQVNGGSRFTVASNGGASIGAFADTPPANGLFVSGNTGIGTSAPTSKLDVRGELRVRSNSGVKIQNSSGSNKAEMFIGSDLGWFRTRGPNGALNYQVTALGSNLDHGFIQVMDAAGAAQVNLFVDSAGNGIVSADTKSFRIPNPANAATEIWYASLEGPEAGAYVRGTAHLVNGRATVSFPEHFRNVAVINGMTVNLTPLSAGSKGLAVVSKALTGVVVEELEQGNGTYDFDYVVMAVRKGHEDYQVIRPVLFPAPRQEELEPIPIEASTAAQASSPDVPEHRSARAAKPKVVTADDLQDELQELQGHLQARIADIQQRLEQLAELEVEGR